MPRAQAFLLALVLTYLPLTAQSIPEIHTTSLAGTPVNLPADLRGRPAVLVLGFTRDSQNDVRAWSKRLAVDYRNSPTLAYYEVAMLGEVPGLMRGFVVRSMKKDVSKPAQPYFLPVSDHNAQWRALAHYDKPADAYILLLDPTGKVEWQTSGPLSDTAYAELKKHLS